MLNHVPALHDQVALGSIHGVGVYGVRLGNHIMPEMAAHTSRFRLPQRKNHPWHRSFARASDEVMFRGYDNGRIQSRQMDDVPDALVKVPGSVGCVFSEDFGKWLPIFDLACSRFVEDAIRKTRILPQMRDAHSIGAIAFLSSMSGRNLPNPTFALDAMRQNENMLAAKAKAASVKSLERLASAGDGVAQKVTCTTTVFARNQYVVELAKRIAEGCCQDCGKPAPFLRRVDGEPYLEVHHLVPLFEGGHDVLENVVALCPNCHRKRHHE